jgi:hypothetical protein
MDEHEHWVKATIVGDEVLVEDYLGNRVLVRGLLIMGHNVFTHRLYGLAHGDPSEIAKGLGETLARRIDDPYYHTVYRAILWDLCKRTGANLPEWLENPEPEATH